MVATSIKQAWVYSDKGANAFSVKQLVAFLQQHNYATTKVLAKDFDQPIPAALSLLAFPGGADIAMAENINTQRATHIKAYVGQGGTYLGICAGSYFAAQEFDWRWESGEWMHAIRPLGFYPGKIIGPKYWPYNERYFETSKLIKIRIANAQYTAFYNGGGFFEAKEFPQVKPLAYYTDNTVAAVRCEFGKGFAYLWAAHVEYLPDLLAKSFLYKKYHPTKLPDSFDVKQLVQL